MVIWVFVGLTLLNGVKFKQRYLLKILNCFFLYRHNLIAFLCFVLWVPRDTFPNTIGVRFLEEGEETVVLHAIPDNWIDEVYMNIWCLIGKDMIFLKS